VPDEGDGNQPLVDLSPEDWGAIAAPELRVLRKSNDHKAAVAAFRERKDPVFTRS